MAPDYDEAAAAAEQGVLEPGVVDCRRYAIPDGTKLFKVVEERFQCTEGLLRPEVWGKDHPSVAELVHKAIQSADIDLRKGLARNIYLSGGSTLIPGFADRLEEQVEELMPASMEVTVHEGDFREHAAYRGAAVVASLNNFDSMCVSEDDWHEQGPSVLKKFQEDNARPPSDMLSSSEDDSDDEDSGGGGGGGAGGYMNSAVDDGGSDDDGTSDDDSDSD